MKVALNTINQNKRNHSRLPVNYEISPLKIFKCLCSSFSQSFKIENLSIESGKILWSDEGMKLLISVVNGRRQEIGGNSRDETTRLNSFSIRWVEVMVFSTTFINILVISWRSLLFVKAKLLNRKKTHPSYFSYIRRKLVASHMIN